MNNGIFQRLIWKEYRLQRSFWIAMVLLTLILMALVGAYKNPGERAQWLFSIALGVPAFYALGCAATMFAGEHDADTYEFLRSLPVSGLRIFWGKLALTVIGIIVMLAVLWLMALVFAWGHLPLREDTREMAALTFFFTWSFVLWGVFLSLLMRRPLIAAILTGIIVGFGPILVTNSINRPVSVISLFSLAIFAGISTVLAPVDIWLGARWLREKLPLRLRAQQAGIERTATRRSAFFNYLSVRSSMIGRLTWQHWRQSYPLAWVLFIAAFLMLVVDLALLMPGERQRFFPYCDFHDYVVFLVLLAIPLLGSFTFLGDQRRSYFRFFAQRGIGPHLVWLSRLWPWLVIVPCFYAVATIAQPPTLYFKLTRSPYDFLSQWEDVFLLPGLFLGYLVLGICVGQLCSMFFRSAILAALFSLALTGAIVYWATLMAWAGISWLWSVAPLPLVMLLATWLRAPDWLLERNSLRAWVKPTVALCLPVIIILTSVALYRAYEFPMVDPGFSVEDFLRPRTPEEQKTLDLLAQAWRQYVRVPAPEPPPPKSVQTEEEIEEKIDADTMTFTPAPWPPPLSKHEIAEVEANQKIIPLLIEISNRTDWNLTDEKIHRWDYSFFPELLINSARHMEDQGNLDAALEQYVAAIRLTLQLSKSGNGAMNSDWRYSELFPRVYDLLPYWAARDGQTPQRIKKAIQELGKLAPEITPNEMRVKYEYLLCKRTILEGFKNAGWANYPEKIPFFSRLWLGLPWERARALRLSNLICHNDLKTLSQAQTDARENERIQTYPPSYGLESYWDQEAPYALRRAIDVPPLLYGPLHEILADQFASLINGARATPVILALQAWRLEHGNLPKKLDELVGPYLSYLPNDPFSGAPYFYYPEGLRIPNSERYYYRPANDDWTEQISFFEISQPLLWSTSERISSVPRDPRTWFRWSLTWGRYGTPYRSGFDWEPPQSAYDLFLRGHFFVVP
jgi:ABC-type transport system involved in multi-copper enzyme maturation permease subunit